MTIDEAIKDIKDNIKPVVGGKSLDMAIEALERQQWVPCSERLPEEREWIGTKMLGTTISNEVFVTFETPDGQRFADHISFQNGKLSRSDEQRMRVFFKERNEDT